MMQSLNDWVEEAFSNVAFSFISIIALLCFAFVAWVDFVGPVAATVQALALVYLILLVNA